MQITATNHKAGSPVFNKILRFAVGGGILVVAVGIAFGLSRLGTPPERKPRELSAPLVDVLEVAPERVRFDVESQGTVEPLTQTTIAAEVAGSIVAMSDQFVAGGTFTRGDVLLRIDPVNYDVTVDRARAALRQRQVEYDGAKKLRQQGYRAESELASAEAALAAAKADLVAAERNLERSVVRAPYDGIVRTRTAQLGDYVGPGAQLGILFSTDAVEIRLPLPDTELPFVNLPLIGDEDTGAGAPVLLKGSFRGSSTTWEARIVRTEGIVDDRNRMVFAVARVADPYRLGEASQQGTPLPVGTFVEAVIGGVWVENVVRIPRTLVRSGNQVVFVDGDSRLRFRILDFIRTDADSVYVDASQLTDRRVLATKLDAPLNGTQVRTALPDELLSGGGAVKSVGRVRSR